MSTKSVFVQITSAGSNTGPFRVYSSGSDGTSILHNSNYPITKTSLIEGVTFDVNDGYSSSIIVESVEGYGYPFCTNSTITTISASTSTTTTTTTTSPYYYYTAKGSVCGVCEGSSYPLSIIVRSNTPLTYKYYAFQSGSGFYVCKASNTSWPLSTTSSISYDIDLSIPYGYDNSDCLIACGA